LDTFVRLIAQLSSSEANDSPAIATRSVSLLSSSDDGSVSAEGSVRLRENKTKNRVGSNGAYLNKVQTVGIGRKQYECLSRKKLKDKLSENLQLYSSNETLHGLTKKRFANRVTFSGLYSSTEDMRILANLFNTRYVSCKHERIERMYEQLRSNDESATLVRVCLDCGRRM
jgi:DNA-directed RNA polymerase subunit M/transcription elongation factor TFIIS